MSQQMVVEHPMIIPTDGGYKSYGNTNFCSIPQKTSPKPQKLHLGLPKAKQTTESPLQNQGLDLRLRAAWCGLGHGCHLEWDGIGRKSRDHGNLSLPGLVIQKTMEHHHF